mmetsp:Transcript_48594/g.92948  ORF Transcript_48594/g.92948 Transcript_48594/m.92948 type:complete len:547 (-) Transcript_48594:377-2017(-)
MKPDMQTISASTMIQNSRVSRLPQRGLHPRPLYSNARNPLRAHVAKCFQRCLHNRMVIGNRNRCVLAKSISYGDDDAHPADNSHNEEVLACESEEAAALCGGTMRDVPHLSEWIPELPVHLSPMIKGEGMYHQFVDPNDVVASNVVMNVNQPRDSDLFIRAGPRYHVHFRSEEVRAAVVTCGGLCPGLNTVIREVVHTLWFLYGVRNIFGVKNGYRGFYSENLINLSPKEVDSIQHKGGTILGTSRGGSDISKIVDSIQARGINHLYVIGGDGTQRGANAIYLEARSRGMKLVVAGIPKTIDNDVSIIDRSFGFDTAVEEAQRAITAAHVEAESTPNGIGLVKVMGRHAGWIAMHASLASRDVDLCLIPESGFYMDGQGGLKEYISKQLAENGHAVVVVAEGAGQDHILAQDNNQGADASGNQKLADIGHWLADKIKDHLKSTGIEFSLKYIDPTYMIRAVPSNASDNVYCTVLAQSAVHGAMAGLTGFTVGPVNGRHAWLPITMVVQVSSQVNPRERMWARLLASTGQPSFNESAVAKEIKSMAN